MNTASRVSISSLKAKVTAIYGSYAASLVSHSATMESTLEAIALSRDIPAALRFVVDPIVRRVSRNSLLISLQQTDEAVGSRSADVGRSAGVRASAEQVRSLPASLSNKSSASTRVH